MGASETKKPLVNRNLISLKCVLFLFYAGLGCLHPYIQRHMTKLGLNYQESQIISIVAPLVAILGPLLVSTLIDSMAGKNGASYGRRLRFITAFCLILSGALYSVLFFLVPECSREEVGRSVVTFSCDSDGAIIFQRRCSEDKTCYHWESEKIGTLSLNNCSYTCQSPTDFESLYMPWENGHVVTSTESTESDDYDQNQPQDDYDSVVDNANDEYDDERSKRSTPDNIRVEPPHICQNEDGKVICHAYTLDTSLIHVDAVLAFNALNVENDTHSAEWCQYPLDGFTCNVPEKQQQWMKVVKGLDKCIPKVECEVKNPYDNPESVLKESVCMKIVGDPDLTFWLYLTIRSIADVFPLTAIVLLNAATIIATRETSTGRGDFGRQMVWGAVGWAIPYYIVQWFVPTYYGYIFFVILAALILLFASKMPLDPPEMWWHAKCGDVVVPMSAVKKYAPETFGLFCVSLILGIFWSVLDNYEGVLAEDKDLLPASEELYGQVWSVFVILAALLVFPILYYAEKIVDYCGHSNILIVALTTYAIRFTILSGADVEYFRVTIDLFYPITVGLTWLTIVFYMRHLVPRRLMTVGQALPVIAYFCLGRFFGAIIATHRTFSNLITTFQVLALVSLLAALLYFVLYHFWLGPKCAAPQQYDASTQALNVNGNQNNQLNGSYEPLRIYHNNRGRKGHFRY